MYLWVLNGTKLKCLRTYNRGEFTSAEFKSFCDLHGIIRDLTNPYNPSLNGEAERYNKTLCESTLHAHEFWGETLNHDLNI